MKALRWYLLWVLFGMLCVTAAQAAGGLDPAKAYPSLAGSLAELYLQSQETPGRLTRVAAEHQELRVTSDGSVLVWVMQAPGKPARSIDIAALRRLGARIAGLSEHFLEAWIPIDVLPRVAPEVAGVTFLMPPIEWQQDYISEGVAATGANVFHDAGFRGAGTKIAVVDLSFGNLSAALSAGELPANTITQDFSGQGMEGGAVHGTACAEVVYDMAPEAQLYIVKVNPSLMSSAENAVDYCLAQGVDVISWSMGQVAGNFFDGQGPLCDIMNNAFAHDVLPVVSVGNYAANASEAHSEGYTSDPDEDSWHEFTCSGDKMLAFNAIAGQAVTVWLNWDGWPTTAEDYDLYVFRDGGGEIWRSASAQTGTQPPIEGGTFTPTLTGTYYLAIMRHASTTHTGIAYEIYIRGINGGFEYPDPQSSITSPADAEGVVAVGAIDQRKWTTGPQEAFSSQGPTNDGRIKPDVCGPDYVSTYTYRPSFFVGTSAATPHVAGVAALLKSAHHTWTAAQIREELLSRATDMGDPGDDYIYGFGRVALPPPHSVTITAISADPPAVDSAGSTQLSATAEDSLGHSALVWSWSDGGAGGTFAPNASAQNPTWTAPVNASGVPVEYQLTVTATCNQTPAAAASAEVIVTVNPASHALTVTAAADHTAVVSGGTVQLSAVAVDTFGHPIAYHWGDGLAGGTFDPNADIANPAYAAPENLSLDDIPVTLGVWVTCDSEEPLWATDELTLAVHPHYDFPDVLWDHWAFDYVEACYRAGIVQGYPNGNYRPEASVTRAQMAVYIARGLVGGEANVPTGPSEPTFPDVPNTGYGEDGTQPYWAYPHIEYCYGAGVVQGYPSGNYRPEELVTRAQMAVYTARAMLGGEAAVPTGPAEPSFPDVSNTGYGDDGTEPYWAYRHIEYCHTAGIVQGYPGGNYRPEEPVSRGHMAIYVSRAFGLMPPVTESIAADQAAASSPRPGRR